MSSANNVIKPAPTDVLCGKKLHCRNHPGTKFVRTECIEPILSIYDGAERYKKIEINRQITLQVYARQGRFLVMEMGAWKKLSFQQARDRVTIMIGNRIRAYRTDQGNNESSDEMEATDDENGDSFKFSSSSNEEWMEDCLEGTSLLAPTHGSMSYTSPSGVAWSDGATKHARVLKSIPRELGPDGQKDFVDRLETSTRQAFASLHVSDEGTQSRSTEASCQNKPDGASTKNSEPTETATGLFTNETLQDMAANTDTSSNSRATIWNKDDTAIRRSERGQDDILTVGTSRGGRQELTAILDRMKDTLPDANSQIKCLGELTELCWKKWANRGIIGEAGGIGGVIAAMGHHNDRPAVQRCGCLALTWLASWGNQESIAAAGGIERIIASMRQHEHDGRVQHRACEVLAQLVGGHRKSIVTAGGVKGVVSAMERHLVNEEVQRHGCRALGGLASFCTSTQDLIVLEGGVATVVNAMIHHVPNEHVQRHGLWTLALLAESSSDNQNSITALGGVRAMVEGMQRHLHNADLQHVGSRSLARLARENPTNQQLIAQSGGIHALLAAMQRHANDDHVQGSVCFAFGCLAYRNQENQTLIRNLNAQDSIKLASTKFAKDDWLQRCAEYALEMIGIPVLCDEYHFGY